MKFILYILPISLVSCDGHGSNDVSVKNNCTIAQSQLMKERLENSKENILNITEKGAYMGSHYRLTDI